MSDPSQKKIMKRGWVVVGAILIQLCLGAIYAWSVFTPALVASDPADVAATYKAELIGIEPARLDQLVADLDAPKKQLNDVRTEIAELKDTEEPDQARIEQLEAEATGLVERMYTVAARYDVEEKVRELAYGLSKTQTQAIFSAGLALFAIVMVLAGRMMPKVGPRKLAIAGGIVLGAGYVLAGLVAPGTFWSTFLFVGIVGGAGIGLAYVVPIAVGVKWFPDKKGLITGLAVAGFGFGATAWILMASPSSKTSVLPTGELLAMIGLGRTFILYGAIFAVAVLVGGLWMVFPPVDWKPAGYTPPETSPGGVHKPGTVDFKPGRMLTTPQFYMIFFSFAFGASAGLMSIGLMKLWPMQALQDAGYAKDEASGISAIAMGVFFALANGLGRIAWGTASDKLGRKASIITMMATQGVFVILFQWMAGTPATLYLFAALIGFNFGGNFALFPTITADTFGSKFIGQNYGWVFLSYGIGGIFGPILGGRLGDLGNFPLAFSICGVLCLVAAAITAGVRPPKTEVGAPAPEQNQAAG